MNFNSTLRQQADGSFFLEAQKEKINRSEDGDIQLGPNGIIENWKNVNDSMEWEVEVMDPG